MFKIYIVKYIVNRQFYVQNLHSNSPKNKMYARRTRSFYRNKNAI